MKKFEDMTLEETMGEVYSIIKSKRNQYVQIILGVIIISLAVMNVFKIDTGSSNLFSLVLISLVILHTNSNSKAIAKLYEKIIKDNKNN